MLGSLRRGEIPDREAYLVSLGAVLAEYDDDVIRYVTDPRTGWPSQPTPDADYYPTLRAMRSLCERQAARKAAATERDLRVERQLADREAAEAQDEAQRASGERERIAAGFAGLSGELRAGLAGVQQERAEAKRRRDALIDRANRRMFERECERSGYAASAVSPSLRAILGR